MATAQLFYFVVSVTLLALALRGIDEKMKIIEYYLDRRKLGVTFLQSCREWVFSQPELPPYVKPFYNHPFIMYILFISFILSTIFSIAEFTIAWYIYIFLV